MRVLQIHLENEDYDRLVAIAAKKAKQPEELAAEGLVEWMRLKESEPVAGEETLKRRFLKLRLEDRDVDAVATELQMPVEVVRDWDRAIRQSPAEWSKAFVYANKTIDALSWEMKIKNRFFTLWGHRPQAP